MRLDEKSLPPPAILGDGVWSAPIQVVGGPETGDLSFPVGPVPRLSLLATGRINGLPRGRRSVRLAR